MEEAREELLDEEVSYPFTQFVVCVGFLLVLIIENIVMSCKPVDHEEDFEQLTPSGFRSIHDELIGTSTVGTYSAHSIHRENNIHAFMVSCVHTYEHMCKNLLEKCVYFMLYMNGNLISPSCDKHCTHVCSIIELGCTIPVCPYYMIQLFLFAYIWKS